MPFLSKDWRDPGDQWVRYDGGWEKRKTLSTTDGSSCQQLSSSFSPATESQQQEVVAATSGNTKDYVAIDRDGNFVNRHMQVNSNVWLRFENNSLKRRQPFCQITLKNTPE